MKSILYPCSDSSISFTSTPSPTHVKRSVVADFYSIFSESAWSYYRSAVEIEEWHFCILRIHKYFNS